jgi:ubiquinone biosynthesis protein COQ4
MKASVKGLVLGQQAQPFFGIQWNKLWGMPVEQVQAQLNLNQAMGKAVRVC